MSVVEDLQNHANEWGTWYSKQHGTSCRWVKLHAEGWGMDQYQQYKIGVNVSNVVYSPQYKQVDLPGFHFTQWYDNGSTVEQNSQFERTTSTQDTFKWSITEGLTIGLETTVTAGVPNVATASEKITTTLSLSSTQETTKTTTKSWTGRQDIKVPPKKSVVVEWSIAEKEWDIDWTCDVRVTGYLAIWNEDKVDGHWLWFFPISQIFMDKPNSKFQVVGGDVLYKAKGTFTGVAGVSSNIVLKEYDLRASNVSNLLVSNLEKAVSPSPAGGVVLPLLHNPIPSTHH